MISFEFFMVFMIMCLVFVLNPLGLGLGMMLSSILLAKILSYYVSSWYGMIFFLVFVSGILVLVFYILSLSFNPLFSFIKFSYVNFSWIIVLYFFMGIFSYLKMFNLTYLLENLGLSWNLFSFYEMWFILFCGIFLLFVLWVVSKCVFNERGVFRPFF